MGIDTVLDPWHDDHMNDTTTRTTTPAGLTATESAYVASLPYRDRMAASYRRHIARMPRTTPASVRRMASAIHLSIWDACR